MDRGRHDLEAAQVLRVLMLEDRDEDALLVEHALRKTGFAYRLQRARGKADFAERLEPRLDLILADFHVPGFGGLQALETVKRKGLDVPLIVVSGAITEAEAAEAVRRGAADYVLKDHLGRLGTAITAALEQKALRGEMREAQAALAKTENEFRSAFEHAATGMAFTTLDGRWLRVNPALCEIVGYAEDELLRTHCHSVTHAEDVAEDETLLRQLLAGEILSSRRDKRYVHKRGHTVWVNVTASLVRDPDGTPLYRVLQVIDITRRIRADERFRSTFEQAAVGIAHTTTDGRFLVVNDKLCEMLGYSRDELLRTTTLELSHPATRGQYAALYQEVAEGRRPRFSGEKRWVRKDGSAIWVNRTVSRADSAVELEPYLIQVIEDITERKRTEESLERANRARRVLAECNHAQMRATDESELLEDMCRAAVELGRYKQAWIGLTTGDSLRPVYAAAHAGYGSDAPMTAPATWTADGRYQGLAGEAIAHGETRIARDILNDPRHAAKRERALQLEYQSSIALPIRGEGRILAVLVLHATERDAFDNDEILLLNELADDIGFGITTLRTRDARRKAEAALRESEERFRVLTELSSDWWWEQDADFRFTEVSMIVKSQAGISAEDHVGRTRWELPRTDPVNTTWDEHEAMLRAHRPFHDLILRRTGEDGSVDYVSVSGRPMFDAKGAFKGYRGVAKNITDKIRADTALRESERRFREMFEQAAVGITRVDLGGFLVDFNQKFCEMLGYEREELLGRHLREITHPDDYGQGSQYRAEVTDGTAKSRTGEKRFVRKDGTILWARRTMSGAHDANGDIQYVISIVEDITERKELERRFELTFDHAAVGMTQVSLDGRFMHVNRKYLDMVGYTREELLAMTTADVTHPDDRAETTEMRNRLLAREIESISGEKRLVCKDGRTIWVRRTSSLARGASGEPLYLITIVEDVTERKRAELELQRKTDIAQLLESLARAANEAASPEAAMHTCVERICEHGGWSLGRLGIYGAEEGGRKQFPEHSVWHPQDVAPYEALVRASRDLNYFAAGGRFISVVLNEKKPVWLTDIALNPGFGRMNVALQCGLRSAFAFPVIVGGEVSAFLEFFAREPREADPLLLEAVTSVAAQLARLIERSRALASASHLAAIVESSRDGIVSVAPDGTVLTWNRGAESLFGYTAGEVVGRNVSLLTPEDRRHEIGQRRAKALAGVPMEAQDTERVTKDGRRVQVSLTASPIRDSSGTVTAAALIYRDITDRKRIEEAASRERSLLRTIIDTVPDYVYVKDREGRFVLANEAWLKARGMGGAEPAGKTVFDFFPADMAEKMAAQDREIVRTGMPLLDREQMIVVKAPDGGPDLQRWSSTTKVPMRDASGTIIGTVGISRDITERRRIERELRQSEERYRDVFETSPLPMWVWDDETLAFLAVNEATVNHYGYTRDEFLRMNVRELWAPGDHARYEDNIRDRLREQNLYLQRRHRTKEGRIIDVEVTARRFALDGRPVWLTLIKDVTERRRAEEALGESEAQLRAMFEQAAVGITMSTLDLKYLQVNDRFCDIVGYSREELLRMSVRDVNLPENMDDAVGYRRKLFAGEIQSTVREKPLRRKDGSAVWVSLVTSVIRDDNGNPKHFLSVIQDISQRKRAEAALMESEERFRQLAANIPEIFWMADVAQRGTVYVSPASERVMGLRPEQISSSPRVLVRAVHRDDRMRVHKARKSAINGDYDETFRIVRPDGSIRWIRDRGFPVRDASGKVYRIAGIAEDITERKEAEERLLQLAHYDVLTSLPNRVLFYDRLKQALAQAKRNHWITGVMFIDLDRFKNVNDTLGHTTGDKLLQQVSGRLTRAVRTGDTVGRLGGDEFAVVLSNLSSTQDASLVAQKIMAAFNEPFQLDGSEIYITVSIGVTLYPTDSTDQDTLIRNADAAMYRAKDVGRNGYQFYTPEMNARSLEMLSLESSLRRALERNEFLFHYQPKASIATGETTGLEALLRWRHPERGLVSPAEFMPIMEETGLIVQAGAWILNTVCSQIAEWQRAGVKPLPIAVNLSARQFLARDLGAGIKRVLERYRIDPALIEFEITESSLMVNTEEASRTLEYLKSLGVGLAIDDFGTGYSSFGYLKRFPLDALKIDRSFVRDITTDADDATITRAVISMAHSLGLKIVAEGVETEAQLAFLAEYGCDQIQGYYLARPMPAEECGAWLKGERRLERPRAGDDASAPLVLLVDDDEDALTLIKRALAKDGNRVLTARNAREALEMLGQHQVDVVISDQSMPGIPGVEFLQRVKALSPRTVRMMTSGYSDFRFLTEAVNKGEIFRFLPKSLTEEELRADVREALRARAEAHDAHHAIPGTGGK